MALLWPWRPVRDPDVDRHGRRGVADPPTTYRYNTAFARDVETQCYFSCCFSVLVSVKDLDHKFFSVTIQVSAMLFQLLFQLLLWFFSFSSSFSQIQSVVKLILHFQKCSLGLVSSLNTRSTWASKSCANGASDEKADVEFQNARFFSSAYFPVINWFTLISFYFSYSFLTFSVPISVAISLKFILQLFCYFSFYCSYVN